MTALVASVFLASLVGGLHCAGMCGGLMAFAIRPGAAEQGSWVRRIFGGQGAYHGGRLVSYATLGGIAGAVGSLLNLGGALVGLSRVAMIVAAMLMIGFGLSVLLSSFASRPLATLKCGGIVAEPLARIASRVQLRAFQLPPARRALLIGLATPLLPCGWLYAFAATAAGTGSIPAGALVMAVFWAGTVPAMAGLGVGLRALFGTAGKRLPLVTSTLLILVGTWTLYARAGLDPAALARAVTPADEVAAPDVPSAEEVPACCRTEGDAVATGMRTHAIAH